MKKERRKLSAQGILYIVLGTGFAILMLLYIFSFTPIFPGYPAGYIDVESPVQIKIASLIGAPDMIAPDTGDLKDYILKYREEDNSYEPYYSIRLNRPFIDAHICGYEVAMNTQKSYYEAAKGEDHELISLDLWAYKHIDDPDSDVEESVYEMDKTKLAESRAGRESFRDIELSEGEFYRIVSVVCRDNYEYSAEAWVYVDEKYVDADETIAQYQRDLTELVNSIVENA